MAEVLTPHPYACQVEGCTRRIGQQLLDLGPRGTIRVCLYANEENGIAGGKAYFKAHEAELSKHAAALESNSGTDYPTAFGWTAGPSAEPFAKEVSAILQPLGAGTLIPGGGGADPQRPGRLPRLRREQGRRVPARHRRRLARGGDRGRALRLHQRRRRERRDAARRVGRRLRGRPRRRARLRGAAAAPGREPRQHRHPHQVLTAKALAAASASTARHPVDCRDCRMHP